MSLFRLFALMTLASLFLSLFPLFGGYYVDIVDPASAAFVLIGTISLLALSQPQSAWKAVVRFVATTKAHPCSLNQLPSIRHFCQQGIRACWATGGLACLMQLATLLHDLNSIGKVLPLIAVSLIPLIYALLLAEFLLVPIKAAASAAAIESLLPKELGKHDPLFADDAVYSHAGECDAAANHDHALYGDAS